METSLKIAKTIFYSPGGTGTEEMESISRGAKMIDDYVAQKIEEMINSYEFPQIHYRDNTLEKFRDIINEKYRVEAHGKSQSPRCCVVRNILMDIYYNKELLSLNEVGLLFGARDHSTVIHSIKKVKDYISINDEVYMRFYLEINGIYKLWQNELKRQIIDAKIIPADGKNIDE